MSGTGGLFIVYTGNGKGKTTAALGLVIRAAGQGKKVRIIQFIKENKRTGEYRFLRNVSNLIDIHTLGRGFVMRPDEKAKDREAALEAWTFAKETIEAGKHEMVVLDELTYPIKFGFLEEEEVLRTIASRPQHVHIVVTGRDGPERLIDAADLVTEMVNRKHPMDIGIKAQKGIEF